MKSVVGRVLTDVFQTAHLADIGDVKSDLWIGLIKRFS